MSGALALFSTHPPWTRRIKQVIGRLVAGLESPLQLAAVGLRGAAQAPARLSFEAGPLQVELRLEATAAGVALTGQALGAAGQTLPLLAWAERDGHLLGETHAPVEEHGVFSMEGLPEPPFDVILDLAEGSVRLSVPGRLRGDWDGARAESYRNTGP